MFGVPWHDRVILGTTDIPVKDFVLEPKALSEEVDFILETAGRYLEKKPERKDVLSVFAGLRPLAAPRRNADGARTKEISRRHKLIVSESGLVTITGGKWTTYRQMAKETLDLAVKSNGLEFRSCKTAHLKIHGYVRDPDRTKWMHIYGSDQAEILKLQEENPAFAEKIDENYDFTVAEVVWAVRKEMARTIDDVLARRIRILFLDARTSIKMAPKVATIMAAELKKDSDWEKQQIEDYSEIASSYIL